ncbi:phosphate ABC transporter substrate-binding protein PstS [Rhizobium gallicum]|uniref:Phosphate-binding protein PstS n=1 Tax=Rhizobium gallicum TaxID=56730 RepID=A0A1L5NLY1_9HYPH|nr:phosphate ABC transporter substrate-binding protein PstS [Rhizobium gallicum]APO68914.1 phosphate ABC transporter substrate-binding protein PstS [Rhizobium gallicum]
MFRSHVFWSLRSGVEDALRILAAVGLLAIAQATPTDVWAEPIRGAGSTFVAPVMAQWAEDYRVARADGGDFSSPDWTVDYELVGSLGGLMRLDQPELDFAATDVPVSPAELERYGRQQFPMVFGSVAVVANVDGIAAGSLRLSGPVIADIYLGKIQRWSDLAIKALNPDLSLPDLKISPLHRTDGSGSTYVFTEYLSAISAEWSKVHGADMLITWPVGTGAEGTRDLIQAVKSTKGAIAYAEYGQVERTGLPFASLQNKSGNFVKPGAEGVQAAVNAVAWDKTKHFYVSLTDLPGKDAYPITTATFAVVPVAGRSGDRFGRVHDLFRLAFKNSLAATKLGYVPVPARLVDQIEQYWAKMPGMSN